MIHYAESGVNAKFRQKTGYPAGIVCIYLREKVYLEAVENDRKRAVLAQNIIRKGDLYGL